MAAPAERLTSELDRAREDLARDLAEVRAALAATSRRVVKAVAVVAVALVVLKIAGAVWRRARD